MSKSFHKKVNLPRNLGSSLDKFKFTHVIGLTSKGPKGLNQRDKRVNNSCNERDNIPLNDLRFHLTDPKR